MNADEARTWRAIERAGEHADEALRRTNRFLWFAYHENMRDLHARLSDEHRKKAEDLEAELG